MQIQVHTDHNLHGGESLNERVETLLRDAVGRFADQITRIEAHLGDENAKKGGGNDMRCMLEARLAGLPPVAVTEHAATLEQAINGAIGKLKRALDTHAGKQESAQQRAPGLSDLSAPEA